MSNAQIGYVNLIDTASLSGGGAVATLPVQNLADAQPAKPYRTIGTSAWFQADFLATMTVAAVALMTTSLTAAGLMRVQLGNGSNSNLLLRSEQFDNASWTKVRSSVTADAIAAPDATTTAEKLVEDSTATNTHDLRQTVAKAAASLPYAVSVFVKAAERTKFYIWLHDGATQANRVEAWYDLAAVPPVAGNVAAQGAGFSAPVATITSVGAGWYRLTLSGTTNATASVGVLMGSATAMGVSTYTGNGTSGLYVWGAMLNPGTTAFGYLPTTSAAATSLVGDVSDTWWTAAGADIRFRGNALYLFPAALSARYCRIDVSDASLSYIDIGRAYVGPLWTPSRNFSYGAGTGFMDLSTKTRSVGGQVHTQQRPRPRRFSLAFNFMTEADAFASALELDRLAGITGDCLVIQNAAGAYLPQTWMWGQVAGMTDVNRPSFNLFAKSYQFEERL